MKSLRIAAALCLMLFTSGLILAQQRPDAEILAEVRRRVGPLPGVNTTIQNGVINLSGTTATLAQRLNAVNMSRRTVGVRQVNDQLTVVPSRPRSDAQITTALNQVLADNLSAVEMAAINVQVQNGVVTLTGTLPGSYPKQVAGVLASLDPGVTNVRNQIVVRPAETRPDADILADVNARYARNPLIPEARITVSVSNSVVTLAGVVQSFVQSEQAESVARFTPGVVDVANNLFVSR